MITRRVGGVEMRVALEPSQYRGVLLSVLVAEATDFLFRCASSTPIPSST